MSMAAQTPEKARFLDRSTPPHILTLVLIAGIGALNLNIILPSLPSIAAYFQTDYAVAQLAISAYLGMTAILQIIAGPLSDRYGRRPVILTCIAIFLFASVVAIFTTSIEAFLAARLVQAVIISGFTLSRAAVRDMVPMDQAASMIGYVTMGMTLVPMAAPIVGGMIEQTYGWKGNFIVSAVFAVIVFTVVALDFRETNTRPTASIGAQFRAYPELLRSRRFWGFTLSAMFASGSFFAFLGGAPFVAQYHLGLSPSMMGFFFIFVALGYMAGNFITGRYASRSGVFTLMLAGNLVAGTGALISVLLFAIGLGSAFSFFGPLFLIGLGNGLTLPSANAGMVSVRPQLAGSAAGLGGALQVGGGAALSVLAGLLLTRESGPQPLLLLMLASALFAVAATLYTRSVARRLEKSGSAS